jgi:DNA-binding response OmpR family regulator
MESRRARILVVEDHANFADAVHELLAPDYAMRIAHTADAALAAATEERPDLVLLDLHLRGRDGFWLLERLRRMDPALPVIMVSGDVETEAAAEALVHGASGYITKPFKPDQLLEVVESQLRAERRD